LRIANSKIKSAGSKRLIHNSGGIHDWNFRARAAFPTIITELIRMCGALDTPTALA
jgi:hypothetical protein